MDEAHRRVALGRGDVRLNHVACGARNGWYLAILELLGLLALLIDQFQIKLCHFAFGHAKNATSIVSYTTELRRIEGALALHDLL